MHTSKYMFVQTFICLSFNHDTLLSTPNIYAMAAAYFVINPPREEVRKRCRLMCLNNLTDNEVIYEYRLTRRQIGDLCELLKADLAPKRDANIGTKRKNLSLEEKVLISLKNLPSGSF